MQTLFTNCTLLTHPEAELISNGYLLTDGEVISSLGPMADMPTPQQAQQINCQGKLLMPGLVNGHAHCAMTLFRGLADDLDLASWLHQHIFPAEAKNVSREMVYWCSRLAVAEMILSGTTCVADAYFFSAEAARALMDCGMRAVVGHGIVDFPAPSVPDPAENIASVARFLDTWLGKHPRITPAVFAHSPYTCSPKTLLRAKNLAQKNGVRFFMHLAESLSEQESIIEPQGPSPLKHAAQLDLLDSNTVLIHAVWLDAEDRSLLAGSGAHVITCPQANLKLASGIAPIPEMLAAEIPVGLGTDGCASNNSMDMFREMDMLAKIHKLRLAEATAVSARQALCCATKSNAEILGLPNIGRLAPGYAADIILLELKQPHLTPLYSADLLVYGAAGSDVQSVMIGGKLVMEDRELLSFDLVETMGRVQQLAASLGAI